MEHNIFNEEDIAKYFAGELDEKKIEMMEKHFFSDKEREKEMNEFAKLWDKSSEVGKYDQIDIDSDWQNVRERMGFEAKTRSMSIRSIVYSAAAAIVLLIGIAAVLKVIINSPKSTGDSETFVQVVSNDAQKEIILPDSTIIFLNNNASVVYTNNYGKTNREVVLTGEAYFNVHKNKELPFKVLTEGSTIEVLGTSFNIRPSEGEITVSVVTGYVAFYETDKKENRVDLVQNQQSRYKQTERIFEPVKILDPNLLTWRTHKLTLLHLTAQQAFEEVARYFNKQLEIENQLLFTDNIIKLEVNVSSPEEAFKDIQLVVRQDYKISVKGDKIIVSSIK